MKIKLNKILNIVLCMMLLVCLYPIKNVRATTTSEIENPSEDLGTSLIDEPIQLNSINLTNWMLKGIKLVFSPSNVNQIIEMLVDLDGSSSDTSTKATLVSPSIDFNTGNVAHTFRFKPYVTNSVGTIRMHGHRVVFVDVFSKIAITLRDSRYNVLAETTNTTNQYTYYDKTSSNPTGLWEASFTTTDDVEWQLYYIHYYNSSYSTNTVNTDSLENNDVMFYYGNNNRFYQYTSAENTETVLNSLNTRNNSNNVLNMEGLNEQFTDSNNNHVDFLKDYNVNDTIFFSDTIESIEYDPLNDSTTFYFLLDDKLIGWKFKNNLTSNYNEGDVLNLKFKVVESGKYNDLQFESLDYFEEVYTMSNDMDVPELSKYIY